MYGVSTQGVDECMINVHYYYYYKGSQRNHTIIEKGVREITPLLKRESERSHHY